MKALVYNGPKDVAVIAVPDARIERTTELADSVATAKRA
jgi:hypothetical protein